VRFAILLVPLAIACRPPGYSHHDVDAAAGKDATHGSTDASPDGSSATTCTQSFSLTGYGTSASVWLTGDFVHWAGDPPTGAVSFTRQVDGSWTGSYQFMAGSFQYKFIVDSSNWIADPSDPNTVPDGFGGVNSVYTCMP